jgi:hypothetical protein
MGGHPLMSPPICTCGCTCGRGMTDVYKQSFKISEDRLVEVQKRRDYNVEVIVTKGDEIESNAVVKTTEIKVDGKPVSNPDALELLGQILKRN